MCNGWNKNTLCSKICGIDKQQKHGENTYNGPTYPTKVNSYSRTKLLLLNQAGWDPKLGLLQKEQVFFQFLDLRSAGKKG